MTAGLLLVWLMLRLASAPELASRLSGLSLAGVLAGFALLTLRLQQRRRRKRVDTTLRYWQLGMASLLSLLPWLVPAARAESLELLVGVLMLLGFGVSVVNGMLLKMCRVSPGFTCKPSWAYAGRR